MNKKILNYASFLFVGLFLSVYVINPSYAKPINLTCAKRALIEYYHDLSPDSEYIKDVSQVVKEAESYLNSRVIKNESDGDPEKLAMVLDIDDTSLTNFPANKEEGFGDSPAMIDARYHAANAPAIAPVMRLYQEALRKNVSVFFITARKPLETKPTEDLRPYTITNLQKVGYSGWAGLYLPQGEDLKLSSANYKTKIRKMLTENGYTIILNLGDQDSDLMGGYAERGYKIPNPIYSTALNPCEMR